MQQRTWQRPELLQFDGQFVTLKPLVLERDVESLYAASHGTPEKEAVWNYLSSYSYAPFSSPCVMKDWMEKEIVGKSDPLAWTIFENSKNTQVGMMLLSGIVPAHGRVEISGVWLTSTMHKTNVNTESQFLMLRYLFDDHTYRRVEWKCDALNHSSRTTATRMGFIYEGRFRQHMLIKGRNRDTDWFAMTDKEWARCKDNFERWLYSGSKTSLTELNNG